VNGRSLMLPVSFVGLLALSCSRPAQPPGVEDKPTTDNIILTDNTPKLDPVQPVPAPQLKADGKLKPWSEMLIGTWKRDKKQSQPSYNAEQWEEFTQDGKWIQRSEDQRGVQVVERGYRLEGSTLIIIEPQVKYPTPTDPYADIEVRTRTIDFASEDQLVCVTILQMRLSRKAAEDTAAGGPIEPLLALVREKRFRNVYDRVNGR